MVYKVSFALILYGLTAVLDAYLGITTYNPNRSLFLRLAAVTTILALFVLLIKKCETLKIFPLFVISLILSFAALTIEGYSDLVIVNTIIKGAAVLLTVKPDLIEIEVLTENEENQQTQQD